MSDGMTESARAEMANRSVRWLAKKIEREFDDHGDLAFPTGFCEAVNHELKALGCSLRLVPQSTLEVSR